MSGAFDFSGFRAVIYKEVRHILREPTTLALIIAMPLMQLCIYGYAINLHVEHVHSLYVDNDRSRASAALLHALRRSQAFQIVGRVQSETALERALVAGRAQVGFIVPKGFSAAVKGLSLAKVQMLVDGSDANVAQAAYAGAAAFTEAVEAHFSPLGESPPVEIQRRTLFNPTLRTPNYLVPGLIGIVMQNVTMVLTALSIVSERERGTLEQMRAMPIGPGAIVLGKLIPYGLVGFLDLLLVLGAMGAIFNVPVAGSMASLLLLSVAFLMACLGFGLLISTVARSQLQAILITVFFLLPSFFLSGMFFEIDQMPVPAQFISYALPMTYFIEILRGIIIRGAGISDLWVPAVVTVAFGVGALAVAGLRFAAKPS